MVGGQGSIVLGTFPQWLDVDSHTIPQKKSTHFQTTLHHSSG